MDGGNGFGISCVAVGSFPSCVDVDTEADADVDAEAGAAGDGFERRVDR